VVRITGPAHNLLGIEFCLAPTDSDLVIVPLKKSTKPTSLSSEDVKRNVLLGVAEANLQFGTNYSAKRIEFTPDDSPPVEIYQTLAKSIIRRLIGSEPFTNG
jgi:hypothetical protein